MRVENLDNFNRSRSRSRKISKQKSYFKNQFSKKTINFPVFNFQSIFSEEFIHRQHVHFNIVFLLKITKSLHFGTGIGIGIGIGNVFCQSTSTSRKTTFYTKHFQKNFPVHSRQQQR